MVRWVVLLPAGETFRACIPAAAKQCERSVPLRRAMYRTYRRITCGVYRLLSTRLSLALFHPLNSGGLQTQSIASAAQALQLTAALLQQCRHLSAH